MAYVEHNIDGEEHFDIYSHNFIKSNNINEPTG